MLVQLLYTEPARSAGLSRSVREIKAMNELEVSLIKAFERTVKATGRVKKAGRGWSKVSSNELV